MKGACLVLVMALAAGACTATDDRTVVRLQVFGDGAEVDAYQSLIDAFEAANDDVRIELIPVADQGDHAAKLAASFTAGDPPELFLINFRRFGQFADRDLLTPLQDHLGELDLDDFYPQALEPFRVGGTQLCMPQNLSSLVVYYNRALFEAADVPEPPDDWTWDDFLATAKALTSEPGPDGRSEVYGVGTDPELIRLAPFVWQAGGEVVDDTDDPTSTTLLGDEALRAVRFFIGLRRTHGVSPSAEEAASEDDESRFAGGRLAMLLASRRVTTAFRATPDLDFDVAPLPRDRERATMLHSDAYCLSNTAADPEAAARFVRFALGPEGAPILARTGRTVPSVRAVAESDAFLDPTQPPSRGRVFLDTIPFIRRTPVLSTWNEIETRADVIVEEWYFGTERPEALGIEIELATRALFAEARRDGG